LVDRSLLVSPAHGAGRTLVGHTLADGDGRILAVDQKVVALFHREEADIAGMSYIDLTHPEDRLWNRNSVETLGATDGPITIRKRYLRPDGMAVWCEAQVSRLGTGSDRGRLIGTLHQLSDGSVSRTPKDLWQSACRMSVALQRRRTELGADLCLDLPWSLLLQLYLAEAEGRCVDLTDLGMRSSIQVESVRRWLCVLDERGLVDTTAAPECAAQLSAVGVVKVERLLNGTAA
jgi:PAS domain S-box-containing protein